MLLKGFGDFACEMGGTTLFVGEGIEDDIFGGGRA